MSSRIFLTRTGLAAIAAAGCVAAPAAATQGADHSSVARANIYVPPSSDTAIRQDRRWLAAHPAPRAKTRETANVYVPPAEGFPTAAPTQALAHAAAPAPDDVDHPWGDIGLVLGGVLLFGIGLAVVQRSRRARRAVA